MDDGRCKGFHLRMTKGKGQRKKIPFSYSMHYALCSILRMAKSKRQRVKRKISFFLLYALCSMLYAIPAMGQIYSEKDLEICNSRFSFAVEKNLSDKPIGDVIVEVGKSFLGVDYEARTLEKEGDEQLVINLTGLDCTTFLENAIVFARLIKKDNPAAQTFEDYRDELTLIRYRDGEIDQYPSRLHYFSDWLYDNQQKEIVKDVTKEMGGEPVNFNLNFMSTHPDAYLHLKDNSEFISIIKKQEEEISSRIYYFIPKEKISSVENKIQNGDIIAFTTNIKGLDIGHVGIAAKEKDGRIHLLHAPNVGYKVQITEEPLSDYIKGIKKHTGIIVLRCVDPEENVTE